MAQPTEVFAQLLSESLAQALETVGASAWQSISRVLGARSGATVTCSSPEARLLMPDELAAEFTEPHVVFPLALANSTGQSTAGWIVLAPGDATGYFGSESVDDALQAGAAAVTQLVKAVTATTLATGTNGLTVSTEDPEQDQLPALVQALDDPCVLIEARLEGGKELPFKLVLSASLLDMLSSGVAAAAPVEEPAPPPAASAFAAEPAPPPAPVREPTPIANAPTPLRAQFSPLPASNPRNAPANIDLLSDLQMSVSVELGRTEMSVADVLALGSGSVVELDRLAGEPVDILVNDRLIARGEVVVVDENFGVRIVEVLARSREAGRAS